MTAMWAPYAASACRHQASRPFWACNRFSASSKTTDSWSIDDFVGNFLPAMGRQTMHEERIGLGLCHQTGVDLVTL